MDSGNRPGTWQRLRIGARRDGTLTAISLLEIWHRRRRRRRRASAILPRRCTPARISTARSTTCSSMPDRAAPMRGPGNTPGAFALEQAIDELAERLGIDPLALRDRIDPSPVRREERRIGAERIGWQRRHAPGADAGPVKRGLGMAQSLWGANVQINAACEVRVLRDGSVEVLSSVQDIGTGIGTVLAQVVAEEFGLRAGATSRCASATPSFRPGRHPTAAAPPPRSRRRRAPPRGGCCRSLFREAALALNAAPEDLVARDGRIVVRDDPSRGMRFREAAARLRTDRISAVASRSDDYGGFRRRMGDAAWRTQDFGGVQFAEVAVDTETGIVRVERVVAVQDCGRPMNPRQIESQVQGGVLMGISYALFEERIIDRHTGRMVNAESRTLQARRPARDAGDRRRGPGKLPGPKRNRCLWHRRARQHRHRAGHRQRRLQRDRRPPAQTADDAGGGARARSARFPRGAEAMNRFSWASARTVSEAASAARRPWPMR